MKRVRNFCAALLMAIPLAVDPAPAAECGDTSGPGGADVPCSCGDTVTTNTKLRGKDPVVSKSRDDACPDFGLHVAAGVNLDLNHRHIRGTLATDQVCGIEILGDGVTVRNGTISRFGQRFAPASFAIGVCQLEGFNGSTILDLEFSDVPIGVIVAGGDGHLVQRNEVSLNRFRTGFGVFLLGTTNATVSQNVVDGAGRGTVGIQTSQNSGLTLQENSVRSNGNGFLLAEESGASIEDNEASDNRGADGFAIGADNSSIRRNTAFRNGDVGLGVGGTGNQVTDNSAANNRTGLGINGSGNTVTANESTENALIGLWLLTGSSGNTLTRNVATENGFAGVFDDGTGNIDGGGNVGTGLALDCQINGAPCSP